MSEQTEIFAMLDMMHDPAFCVMDGIVARVNPAARGLLIEQGTAIANLLRTGQEEYEAFTGGCLCLELDISGIPYSAAIRRIGNGDIFTLEAGSASSELAVLALAARELREPLAKVMLSADRLYNPEHGEEAAKMTRGLYQILRILGNMSDAADCSTAARKETVNICQAIGEVFEKAHTLISHTGVEFSWEVSAEAVYCLADIHQLERAILNILSNSMKYTPTGGSIRATFSRKGRTMQLRIQDSGSGIADSLLPTAFSRYLRQPTIEDGRHGLGLGLVMIRGAAASHGGTVLIDRPNQGGTGITLTIPIVQSSGNSLRSPALRVDYGAERDHALLELSEILPVQLYQKEK